MELDGLKELMLLGDMYNVRGLVSAAASEMKQFITEENVMELLSFTKNIVTDSENCCLEFIVKNFGFDKLKEAGTLKEHPEIAVKYAEYLESKFHGDNFSSVWSPVSEFYMTRFSPGCSVRQLLCFHTDTTIMLSGIGISLNPGSEGTVRVAMCRWNEMENQGENIFKGIEKIDNMSDGGIFKFKFPEHLELTSKDWITYTILAEIEGNGSVPSAIVCKPKNKTADNVFKVNGGDKNGMFVKPVEFCICKSKYKGFSFTSGKPGALHTIPELYFHIP